MDRIAIAEGHNVAMLEWGHYAGIARLQGEHGFRAAPGQDTHRALIEGADDYPDREAHRAYHYASRRYARANALGRFDPYDPRGPLAQSA